MTVTPIKPIVPPKAAGYYKLGKDARMYLMVRPNWWFRMWCHLLLGWEWRNLYYD
jgi:hypothetical protein